MNIRMPTRNEIHAAFSKGEQAIVKLFDAVGKQVEGLANQLEKQNDIIKELQARLSKDSHNSSKPPSSDGLGKKPNHLKSEPKVYGKKDKNPMVVNQGIKDTHLLPQILLT